MVAIACCSNNMHLSYATSSLIPLSVSRIICSTCESALNHLSLSIMRSRNCRHSRDGTADTGVLVSTEDRRTILDEPIPQTPRACPHAVATNGDIHDLLHGWFRPPVARRAGLGVRTRLTRSILRLGGARRSEGRSAPPASRPRSPRPLGNRRASPRPTPAGGTAAPPRGDRPPQVCGCRRAS